jgi:hypothetical protein
MGVYKTLFPESYRKRKENQQVAHNAAEAANKAATNKAAANESTRQEGIAQLQALFPITIGKYGLIQWENNEDRTAGKYTFDTDYTQVQSHGLYLLPKVWGLDTVSSYSTSQPEAFKDTEFSLRKESGGETGDVVYLTYRGVVLSYVGITYKGEVYGH